MESQDVNPSTVVKHGMVNVNNSGLICKTSNILEHIADRQCCVSFFPGITFLLLSAAFPKRMYEKKVCNCTRNCLCLFSESARANYV